MYKDKLDRIVHFIKLDQIRTQSQRVLTNRILMESTLTIVHLWIRVGVSRNKLFRPNPDVKLKFVDRVY